MNQMDRETLELAALAAGIELAGFTEHHSWPVGERLDGGWWDPITDGEDALSMAAELKMSLSYGSGTVFAQHRTSDGFWINSSSQILADEPGKAYRTAIIECAAKVGKTMREKH